MTRWLHIVVVAVTAAMSESSCAVVEYSDDCPCCYHRPSRDVQLIPKVFRPWLGQLNVPHTFSIAFDPFSAPCGHAKCSRGQRAIQNIQWTAPGWFAHIEATIRFKTFPVHFCIQTPRVVPSLHHLTWISLDEFKIQLSTRELTLCDVDPEGESVLHVSPEDFSQGASEA